MDKTKQGLIEWCHSKLGTPYVYGTKGEKLTLSKINLLAGLYPSTFTSSYIEKSKKFIGQNCADCSGLISWYTGIVRGSYQYKTTATAVYGISQLDESMIGYALWKPGHIGIYIGNDECIEAKGIHYGTVKTKVSSNSFTHVLRLCDIDYSEPKAATGWKQDDTGYRYVLPDGTTAAGWCKIDSIWYYFNTNNGYMVTSDWVFDNGHWYYLNANGTLYYGWLLYKDKWLYLNKDGTPEGAAVTGFQKLKWHDELKDYYFDGEGYMITEEFTVVPDDTGALRIEAGIK